jgi:hypothetical protein
MNLTAISANTVIACSTFREMLNVEGKTRSSLQGCTTGNMARRAARGTRWVYMCDGMGLSDAAEKARYRELLCRTDLTRLFVSSLRREKREKSRASHPNFQLPRTAIRFSGGFSGSQWLCCSCFAPIAHSWP